MVAGANTYLPKYPSGCLLNSSYYLTSAATTIGTSSFLSPTGASETGHTSNGYVRITIVELAPTCHINLGNTEIKYIQLGTTNIIKAYMGTNLVFKGKSI